MKGVSLFSVCCDLQFRWAWNPLGKQDDVISLLETTKVLILFKSACVLVCVWKAWVKYSAACCFRNNSQRSLDCATHVHTRKVISANVDCDSTKLSGKTTSVKPHATLPEVLSVSSIPSTELRGKPCVPIHLGFVIIIFVCVKILGVLLSVSLHVDAFTGWSNRLLVTNNPLLKPSNSLNCYYSADGNIFLTFFQ